VRVPSYFIDNDSCLSGSDSYGSSFPLLLRGQCGLSSFPASWLRGAFLRPLRGPPSFLIKRSAVLDGIVPAHRETTRTGS